MPPEDTNAGSDQSSQREKETKSTATSADRDHLLLRRGTSLDGFGKLASEPDSLEAKIARGRGGGDVLTEEHAETLEREFEDTITTPFDLEEGMINLETGYVMHFVPESQTALSLYDIISLPDDPCYPVSESTYESLPEWAQTQLENQGHLKCTATYDQDSKQLRGISLGWETAPTRPADTLAELIDNLEGDRLAGAVYKFLLDHASSQYNHPEAIAALRGIKPESVNNELKRINNDE